jgi:hypothetical protein
MKLVDVPDSKSGGEIRAGSSPVAGTNKKLRKAKVFLLLLICFLFDIISPKG